MRGEKQLRLLLAGAVMSFSLADCSTEDNDRQPLLLEQSIQDMEGKISFDANLRGFSIVLNKDSFLAISNNNNLSLTHGLNISLSDAEDLMPETPEYEGVKVFIDEEGLRTIQIAGGYFMEQIRNTGLNPKSPDAIRILELSTSYFILAGTAGIAYLDGELTLEEYNNLIKQISDTVSGECFEPFVNFEALVQG